VKKSFTDFDPWYRDDYFEPILTPFKTNFIFFEAAGAVAKVGLNLKLNHLEQI
jgi:hypothetical protein